MTGLRWFPWKWILSRFARSKGFVDPIALLSRLKRFSRTTHLEMPYELLRAGATLQARGLINSQAIQHNLDWVWPYWVERQFDPRDPSFIPRAFNLTHINLTHRNWTAIGLPDVPELPIVDPRGLVTPHLDGWSIDVWIVSADGRGLYPSKTARARQRLEMSDTLAVVTRAEEAWARLETRAKVVWEGNRPTCRIEAEARCDVRARMAVSLRPYNPEGISPVSEVRPLRDRSGWRVDSKRDVRWNEPADEERFSDYEAGDAARSRTVASADPPGVRCEVGMATAVAFFEIAAGTPRRLTIDVPLGPDVHETTPGSWAAVSAALPKIELPEERFVFLHEAALRTIVLHSPSEIYPGPYTYKRFWFRDAAFILDAMIGAGLLDRAERALELFPSRQTPFGYFLSQEGEWDSNGEALWIYERYCRTAGRPLKPEWKRAVTSAARWIQKKRLPEYSPAPWAGLFPPGFSAEHLGPVDYYYWDDFWGAAGLAAAASLEEDPSAARQWSEASRAFLASVERSLESAASRLGTRAMPATPYRRLDGGSIGSLAAGYPLQCWPARDERLTATVGHLLGRYFIEGGFYQEISHSGINPYLTLHAAQVLLRAGDSRFLRLARRVAELASPTGQWPEAVHPITRGGCMGDGQHVWAAAEWVILMRHLFVREERVPEKLVLGQGLVPEWRRPGTRAAIGPVHTRHGRIEVSFVFDESRITVEWKAAWHGTPPAMEVALPGLEPVTADASAGRIELIA